MHFRLGADVDARVSSIVDQSAGLGPLQGQLAVPLLIAAERVRRHLVVGHLDHQRRGSSTIAVSAIIARQSATCSSRKEAGQGSCSRPDHDWVAGKRPCCFRCLGNRAIPPEAFRASAGADPAAVASRRKTPSSQRSAPEQNAGQFRCARRPQARKGRGSRRRWTSTDGPRQIHSIPFRSISSGSFLRSVESRPDRR